MPKRWRRAWNYREMDCMDPLDGMTAHSILFVLAVLAIVPLAALLSHATDGRRDRRLLLNATLGALSGSETSQITPRAFRANACKPLTAAASALVVSMSASITFIPACANARPSASPMPLAPPVTNAVLLSVHA